jgi:hypothetical protein
MAAMRNAKPAEVSEIADDELEAGEDA